MGLYGHAAIAIQMEHARQDRLIERDSFFKHVLMLQYILQGTSLRIDREAQLGISLFLRRCRRNRCVLTFADRACGHRGDEALPISVPATARRPVVSHAIGWPVLGSGTIQQNRPEETLWVHKPMYSRTLKIHPERSHSNESIRSNSV